MTEFKIIENYRDNDFYRESFFDLTRKVFNGLDFKTWYQKGFWADAYVPYAIVKDNQIISNVSISTMQVYVNGEIKKGLQFATVGTLPEYRKQGLSRELMNYVLDKYKDWADIHFLFANETVTGFYPLFGFKLNDEVVFRSLSDLPSPKFFSTRLDLNNPDDVKLIKQKVENRKPITKLFGAENYGFITFWHLVNIYPDDIYYLKDEDIIIIATEEAKELHIRDIIFENEFDLNKALQKITKNKIEAVNYYFSPDVLRYNFDETAPTKDSPLFIIEDMPFKKKLFKFPATAQT
ncbi:MAG: GNAT family N-acetyltransferase [Ignavibacteria bacterium]